MNNYAFVANRMKMLAKKLIAANQEAEKMFDDCHFFEILKAGVSDSRISNNPDPDGYFTWQFTGNKEYALHNTGHDELFKNIKLNVFVGNDDRDIISKKDKPLYVSISMKNGGSVLAGGRYYFHFNNADNKIDDIIYDRSKKEYICKDKQKLEQLKKKLENLEDNEFKNEVKDDMIDFFASQIEDASKTETK